MTTHLGLDSPGLDDFRTDLSGALALGKVPGLRIDRAGIALVGAAAMLACGVLSMRDAAKAVDYETIVLLFGMMVVVAYLRIAGFFALATDWIAARFSGPFTLLAVTIVLSGVLSAFLVNDVVCVALTPLVLHLCQRLEAAADPLPGRAGDRLEHRLGRHDHGEPAEHHHRLTLAHFLLAVRRAAGPRGRDRPGPEFRRRGPGLPQDLERGRATSAERCSRGPRVHRGLLIKSVAVTLVTVGFFFAGQPIALVAWSRRGS